MATLEELIKDKRLVQVTVPLEPDDQPFRKILVVPRVMDWMENELRGLAPDGFYPDAATPKQQAFDWFSAFIRGESKFEMEPFNMEPTDQGVWEMRTFDLRLFGWCCSRYCLILSAIETKVRCQTHDLYHGFLRQVVTDRNALDLDEPKYIAGGWHDCF